MWYNSEVTQGFSFPKQIQNLIIAVQNQHWAALNFLCSSFGELFLSFKTLGGSISVTVCVGCTKMPFILYGALQEPKQIQLSSTKVAAMQPQGKRIVPWTKPR